MGTTKLHHQHYPSHPRDTATKSEMDTYIPVYSILHRVAAPPPSATSLDRRLEAPPSRTTLRGRTDLLHQPYSPTTLAERLGISSPPVTASGTSSSSNSYRSQSSSNRSTTTTRTSRDTPYARDFAPSTASRRTTDEPRGIIASARGERQKGDYRRPSPHSSRTSSIETPSISSSSSPPSSRRSYVTNSSDRILPRDSVNLIPVNHTRQEERMKRTRSYTNENDGRLVQKRIRHDDSGYGISLADRISPPSTTTEFPTLSPSSASLHQSNDNSTSEMQDQDRSEIIQSYSPIVDQDPSPTVQPASLYVYEPRRSASTNGEEFYEEGELVEDVEGSPLRGTKIIISNLEPGTTTDDVAAVFNQFGEIVGANTSPTFSGNLDEESILLVFASAESATEAILQMNGVLADGRKLSVTLAG